MDKVDPCHACDSHKELEDKVDIAIEKGDTAIERFDNSCNANTKEHGSILNNIDLLAADINWIKTVSKWLLGSIFVTILGYFISIGYFVFANEWATKDDLKGMNTFIKEGEILHYQNEKNIASMETKIDMILEKQYER